MSETQYLWDVESDNVLQELDEFGDTQVTYTNEPAVFGNLVSQRRGTETSTYHFDGLGSTRELTNSSEVVTDTNMYDAWGVSVADSGATVTPYRWVGERGYHFGELLGSYYVRARRYSQSIARWTSIDPLYPHVLNDWIKQYLYARNSPRVAIDPSGYICQESDPPKDDPCAAIKDDPKCKLLKPAELPKLWDKQESRSVLGLTYCKDGVLKYDLYKDPQDGEPDTTKKRRQDPCYMMCVEEHEKYHIKQVKECCPKFCDCHNKGSVDIAYVDDEAMKLWECPAHLVFVKCLLKVFNDGGRCGQNRDMRGDIGLIHTAIEEQLMRLEQECDLNQESELPEVPKCQ